MKKNIKLEKSRLIIRDAFVHLLLERNFNKITISDVCKQAHVGRSTFYNHYTDKMDLLEDTIAFYSRVANDTTYTAFITEDQLDLHANLLRDYQTIIKYNKIIQALLSVRLPNASFESEVRSMLARKYKVLIKNHPAQNTIPEDLAIELYTSNALHITKYIAYHADTADIEQLADFMFGIYQTILSPIQRYQEEDLEDLYVKKEAE